MTGRLPPAALPAAALVVRGLPVVALLLFVGCAAGIEGLPVSGGGAVPCCGAGDPEPRTGVTVQYLGVGGWLIRQGDAALLTAPFFSNPGLLRVGFWTVETDTALVDRFMPPAADVSAILVGHAHYDHLLDVPRVALRHAPDATVYGSRTAVHTLAGVPGLEGRLVAVDDRAGSAERAGAWIHTAGGRVRFMPLAAEHAPHFMGVELFEGRYLRPLPEPPPMAWDWLEGRTLGYLIDLLDEDGRVVFRIHYVDAASDPPAAFLPPEIAAELDRRPVDLAILCPASFEQVDRYPEGIVRHLRPRFAVLGHWEDFFRPRTEPLRPVPLTDLGEFTRRLDAVLEEVSPGAGWALPEPGAVFRFTPR